MEKFRLGRTDLMVSRSAFGALPIQRVSIDTAKVILRKAYDNGINFFDTARAYTDSEEKIGQALSDVRSDIIISTKTNAKDKETLLKHLETSLKTLKTDYVDILQLHNPQKLPTPQEQADLYEGLLEAKRKGMTRYIGITNHTLQTAMEAAESGLYDTIQFPFSLLSTPEEIALVKKCQERDLGFLAMKTLAGGIITNSKAVFTYIRQHDNVLPLWGIQHEWELDEFLAYEKNPPALDATILSAIEKERSELSGSFCRGCGYCLPCPVGINIPVAARMSYILTRAPYQKFLEDDERAKMLRIKECLECGECAIKCPYNLDTPNLLKHMLENYEEFYQQHK